jgi:protein-S-isoprenylcysteine O-methyltransferase Ste14
MQASIVLVAAARPLGESCYHPRSDLNIARLAEMANASDPVDHANVRIPPPLIFAGGLIVGLLLEEALPSVAVPAAVIVVAAPMFLVLWAVITAWSVLSLHRNRTTLIPIRPTTALVVSGPYRFTRNPMYVGMVYLYLAFALWFNVFWAVILLPVVIGVVHSYVIGREERYLERKFGDSYREYKSRVRRWI